MRSTEREVQKTEGIEQWLGGVPEGLEYGLLRDLSGTRTVVPGAARNWLATVGVEL